MAVTDEKSSLLETLEQTRIAAEEIERRVTERRRRATNPYLAALNARLPPPAPLPSEYDEPRIRRSEAPTQRMRSPILRDDEPPTSTRYSIINGRDREEGD